MQDMAADPARLDLELCLDTLRPEELRPLLKLWPARRGPGQQVRLRWHDSPEFSLAADNRALVEQPGRQDSLWRLEALHTAGDAPGKAPAILDSGSARHGLDADLPAELVVLAAFDGRSRGLAHPTLAVTLLEGSLAATGQPPRRLRRLRLSGPPAEVADALRLLPCPAALPPMSLSGQALAAAGAWRPPEPAAPMLAAGMDVGAAFAAITGAALGSLLHQAGRIAGLAAPGADPEPVHQMRVAIRRQRAAIALFRQVVACPELDAAAGALRSLGQSLGAARDRDVFLDGTGARLAEAFPDTPALDRLLRAVSRQRAEAYRRLQAKLAAPGFHRLTLDLASLAACRLWPATPHRPLGAFAGALLDRRRRRIRRHGRHLDAVPDAELHAIRLQAKRLRYAAEFVAPLYPGRGTARFLRRLSRLQQALGLLNDSVAAGALMAELGAPGRGYAGGLVRGYAAGHAAAARPAIAAAWERFRRCAGFWNG